MRNHLVPAVRIQCCCRNEVSSSAISVIWRILRPLFIFYAFGGILFYKKYFYKIFCIGLHKLCWNLAYQRCCKWLVSFNSLSSGQLRRFPSFKWPNWLAFSFLASWGTPVNSWSLLWVSYAAYAEDRELRIDFLQLVHPLPFMVYILKFCGVISQTWLMEVCAITLNMIMMPKIF